MKKKPNSTKKATPKKAVVKKAVVKKAAPKKAAPKKAAPKKAAALVESFRPVCITEDIRLDERCMTRSEAFAIAQAHRNGTNPRHSVDIESC